MVMDCCVCSAQTNCRNSGLYEVNRCREVPASPFIMIESKAALDAMPGVGEPNHRRHLARAPQNNANPITVSFFRHGTIFCRFLFFLPRHNQRAHFVDEVEETNFKLLHALCIF